jgi:hypothetical protein
MSLDELPELSERVWKEVMCYLTAPNYERFKRQTAEYLQNNHPELSCLIEAEAAHAKGDPAQSVRRIAYCILHLIGAQLAEKIHGPPNFC